MFQNYVESLEGENTELELVVRAELKGNELAKSRLEKWHKEQREIFT